MPSMAYLSGVWSAVRELDVSALLEEAKRTPRLALIGPPDKTNALQAALQRGPHSDGQPLTAIPVYRFPLGPQEIEALAEYDLRLALLSDAQQVRSAELAALGAQPAPLLAVLDAPTGLAVALGTDSSQDAARSGGVSAWQPTVIVCPLSDNEALVRHLWPALIEAFGEREIALARAYPALRPAVSHKLIQSVSLANATYAFGTGVVEILPVLALPLTAADIIVLTKNQLLLAYKVALVMGETATLQEILPKLLSVVGLGIVWRQVARTLVGLIPGLGIVPKVAVAYGGTYTSGQAIYQWYVNGEKLRGQALQQTLAEALERGRAQAALMLERLRRDRKAAEDAGQLPQQPSLEAG